MLMHVNGSKVRSGTGHIQSFCLEFSPYSNTVTSAFGFFTHQHFIVPDLFFTKVISQPVTVTDPSFISVVQ